MVCHPCHMAGNLTTEAYGRIHGSGTYIQVKANGTGGLRRVRRNVCGRIPFESYEDSTWEGGRETAAMEHTGRGDQTPDLPYFLPGEGITTEMLSVGVPGKSDDEDVNAGALCAPACA